MFRTCVILVTSSLEGWSYIHSYKPGCCREGADSGALGSLFRLLLTLFLIKTFKYTHSFSIHYLLLMSIPPRPLPWARWWLFSSFSKYILQVTDRGFVHCSVGQLIPHWWKHQTSKFIYQLLSICYILFTALCMWRKSCWSHLSS